MKSLDWLRFPRKVNKLTLYVFYTIIHDGVYSDWLALINCAASLPAILLQVQENLLLLSSNTPPTSVNSNCPDMSSPLLRHHNETFALLIVKFPTVFWKNILVIFQKYDL